MIGKLEELTLLALSRAGSGAIANEVYSRVIEGQPKAAFGAVYTTLTRLAQKGFVEESPTADSNGRVRRGFSITGGGRAALSEALDATAAVGGWQRGNLAWA